MTNSKKIIIFDFDGVILNSNYVKTKTFYNLFKSYGKKIANNAVKYHLNYMGVPRQKKFKYIYKNFLKKKISKKILDNLDFEFRKKSLKKIYQLNVSKPLNNFIRKNYRNYNLYISTGAPKNEIVDLLKRKKIFKKFKKVYGPPTKKYQHINLIRKSKKGDIIFIGDSLEDYRAAKKSKIKFILKKHKENINIFKDKKVIQISNFVNFEKKLIKTFM